MKKFTVVTICHCGCPEPTNVFWRRAMNVDKAINSTLENAENGDSLSVVAVFPGWIADISVQGQRVQSL